MNAGWQDPPPGAPGGWGEPRQDTGDRLRAALAARSAQVGPDTPWASGDSYDRTGYTRADEGEWPSRTPGPGGSGAGGWSGGPGRRAPLFPRWAKLTLAVGLVLSAVLGVVLGLHSSSDSTPALPAARETSYGSDRARVAIVAFYRQDRFVTLELELTNLAPLGSDNSWSVNSAFADSGYDLSGLRLLDPVSGGSYRPAEDGKGDCICTSTISLTIEAGSSTRVSAQFPAPAANVKKMTINVPGVGSFPDVQLS